jgi:hypothetical protein
MGKINRAFVVILSLIIAISCLTLFTAKPSIAQYNSAPSVSIVYPTNGTVVDANMGMVSIRWQYPMNTTFSWVGYSLNGAGNITVTGEDQLGDIENNGDYTVTLYANDTTGNWSTPQTVNYHVNVIGDAIQENPIVPIAVVLVVIILFALAVLVAYRRHQKTHNLKQRPFPMARYTLILFMKL